jgi:hypothetical protein
MSAIALTLGSWRGGRDDVSGFLDSSNNDTTHTHFHILAARCARVLPTTSRPKKERAQGRPGARCTRGLACQDAHSKTHTSIQVQRKQSGLPCAMVLRLISCSPRRDLACLSPSSRRILLLRNLTPATGASGPHDFAVRLTRCSSKAHPRPPLPAPTSVTMANAPSLGTGWRGIRR